MAREYVATKNGTGQCKAEACTVQTIEAGPVRAGRVFKQWTGDTAWLKDPTLAKTTLTVPFKDIRLEAVFTKVQ